MLWVYQGLRQDFALKGLIHITVLRFCYSYVIHYLLLWERQEAKRVRERKTKRARKCMLCVQVGFELPQRWRGGALKYEKCPPCLTARGYTGVTARAYGLHKQHYKSHRYTHNPPPKRRAHTQTQSHVHKFPQKSVCVQISRRNSENIAQNVLYKRSVS